MPAKKAAKKKAPATDADAAGADAAAAIAAAEPKTVEGIEQSPQEAKRQAETETAPVPVRRDGNGALIV